MHRGSTVFLKFVICLLGLLALGISVIVLGNAFFNKNVGMYFPLLIGIAVTAIPFLYALYNGLLLLRYIEKNTAFSEKSVVAIKRIEYCAFAISTLYALSMPYIIYLAEKDDAPGAVIIGLLFIGAPLVTGVFAAVLQKLLQNAIEIKSENDLTV